MRPVRTSSTRSRLSVNSIPCGDKYSPKNVASVKVAVLAALVRQFGPGPQRRLGVLVDHLVTGSKESRIVGQVSHPQVLVTGHPYVDIWQAVKPAAVGIAAWPVIPLGVPWKEGVCAALGWGESWEGWRRVLAAVDNFADVEVPLLQSVEHLIDFVTGT